MCVCVCVCVCVCGVCVCGVCVCNPKNVVGKIESGKGENSNCWSALSGMKRSENERDAFWEYFNECINGFSENGRIEMLSDMNLWKM